MHSSIWKAILCIVVLCLCHFFHFWPCTRLLSGTQIFNYCIFLLLEFLRTEISPSLQLVWLLCFAFLIITGNLCKIDVDELVHFFLYLFNFLCHLVMFSEKKSSPLKGKWKYATENICDSGGFEKGQTKEGQRSKGQRKCTIWFRIRDNRLWLK